MRNALLIFISALFLVFCLPVGAQPSNAFQLNRAYLITPLDGHGQSATNFGRLVTTNFNGTTNILRFLFDTQTNEIGQFIPFQLVIDGGSLMISNTEYIAPGEPLIFGNTHANPQITTVGGGNTLLLYNNTGGNNAYIQNAATNGFSAVAFYDSKGNEWFAFGIGNQDDGDETANKDFIETSDANMTNHGIAHPLGIVSSGTYGSLTYDHRWRMGFTTNGNTEFYGVASTGTNFPGLGDTNLQWQIPGFGTPLGNSVLIAGPGTNSTGFIQGGTNANYLAVGQSTTNNGNLIVQNNLTVAGSANFYSTSEFYDTATFQDRIEANGIDFQGSGQYLSVGGLNEIDPYNHIFFGAPWFASSMNLTNSLSSSNANIGTLTVSNSASITGLNASFAGPSSFPANSDVAYSRYAVTTLANGNNSDINTGTNVFVELSGNTGPVYLAGFAAHPNRDGAYRIILYRNSYPATIGNLSGIDSTAANRIQTMTGADRYSAGPFAATLVYSAAAGQWMLTQFESISTVTTNACIPIIGGTGSGNILTNLIVISGNGTIPATLAIGPVVVSNQSSAFPALTLNSSAGNSGPEITQTNWGVAQFTASSTSPGNPNVAAQFAVDDDTNVLQIECFPESYYLNLVNANGTAPLLSVKHDDGDGDFDWFADTPQPGASHQMLHYFGFASGGQQWDFYVNGNVIDEDGTPAAPANNGYFYRQFSTGHRYMYGQEAGNGTDSQLYFQDPYSGDKWMQYQAQAGNVTNIVFGYDPQVVFNNQIHINAALNDSTASPGVTGQLLGSIGISGTVWGNSASALTLTNANTASLSLWTNGVVWQTNATTYIPSAAALGAGHVWLGQSNDFTFWQVVTLDGIHALTNQIGAGGGGSSYTLPSYVLTNGMTVSVTLNTNLFVQGTNQSTWANVANAPVNPTDVVRKTDLSAVTNTLSVANLSAGPLPSGVAMPTQVDTNNDVNVRTFATNLVVSGGGQTLTVVPTNGAVNLMLTAGNTNQPSAANFSLGTNAASFLGVLSISNDTAGQFVMRQGPNLEFYSQSGALNVYAGGGNLSFQFTQSGNNLCERPLSLINNPLFAVSSLQASNIVSTATNAFAAMTSVGWTNTYPGDAQIFDFTCTSAFLTNRNSGQAVSLGNLTAPTTFTIQTNMAIVGTGCAAAAIWGL